MASSTLEPSGAIRTYQGRSVEELIPKIQAELGSDAIIVRRREGLTGGLAGFFQRPFVEIDAIAGGPQIDVYDEEPLTPTPELPRQRPLAPEQQPLTEQDASLTQQLPRTPFYTREPQQAIPGGPPQAIPREPPQTSPGGRYVTGNLAELVRASGQPQPPESESVPPREPGAIPPIARRAGELGAGLGDPFARILEQANTEPSSRVYAKQFSVTHATRPASSKHGRARTAVHGKLVGLGISEGFAEETIDAALTHILPLAPRGGLGRAVRSALVQRIPVAPQLPTSGAAIVLVGPGGAGKTSCCAALLAAYRENSPLRASCATLVRGPGKDELQMLLSPQIRKLVAVDTARATRALRKAREEGLLVIDTPPLSPGDRSGIRKLSALLGELEPERVAIAMPATLGAVAAAQLLQALRPLGANALALTHADETDQLGIAVEAACTFNLAPEYALDRKRSGGWRLGRIDPTGLAATLLP